MVYVLRDFGQGVLPYQEFLFPGRVASAAATSLPFASMMSIIIWAHPASTGLQIPRPPW
jgi:hypothetical protein